MLGYVLTTNTNAYLAKALIGPEIIFFPSNLDTITVMYMVLLIFYYAFSLK